MVDPRAAVLATSDVAFFALPPNRPSRSTRRTDGGKGAAQRLIRAIGRELARATEEPGTAWLPRLTRYPY